MLEGGDRPVEASTGVRYVGFWVRLVATLIDSILFLMIIFPVMYLIYGSEYFLGGAGAGGAFRGRGGADGGTLFFRERWATGVSGPGSDSGLLFFPLLIEAGFKAHAD